jgi:hypothetical protein
MKCPFLRTILTLAPANEDVTYPYKSKALGQIQKARLDNIFGLFGFKNHGLPVRPFFKKKKKALGYLKNIQLVLGVFICLSFLLS